MKQQELENIAQLSENSINVVFACDRLCFLDVVRKHVISKFQELHSPGILTADVAFDEIEEDLKNEINEMGGEI